MRSKQIFCVTACAALFFRLNLQAAEILWTNQAGGNWATAANWNPNQVPGASDNAYITTGGTYTVTVNAATSVNSVTVGGMSGTQTLSLTAGTFTINLASAMGTNGVLSLAGGTLAVAADVTVAGT